MPRKETDIFAVAPKPPKTINMAERWEFLPKADDIRASKAPNKLAVGGTGSGKSANMLMHGVIDYAMRWEGCNILVMRRTYPELEKGLIADFKTYVPEELFRYNESKHVATLWNGSKVFFGHLATNSERDLHTYLSSSFCFILIDECGQFSLDAWQFLRSRNRVNPECKPNAAGEYPIPCMVGATNPIGPYWADYKTVFVDKKPIQDEEGMRRVKSGRYYIPEAGEWKLIFDPSQYDHVHSTVLDNPYMLAKDPGIVQRLELMPKDMREKLLWGSMDGISGQYFSNFAHQKHVINLRSEPDRIIWQPWQPKWIGMDFGRAHYCSVYWFTKALLKRLDGSTKLVTVCYREMLVTGKNNVQLADEMTRLSTHTDEHGKKTIEKIQAIYFSHEKFGRQMEAHSPADEFSRLLRARGLCNVSPATRDRVGRASLTYNLLDNGTLLILDSCPEIIKALGNRVRSEKNIEDVEKVDDKGDDAYDGFTYGVFGYLNTKPKPKADIERDRVQALANDPLNQRFAIMKIQLNARKQEELANVPAWQRRLKT